MLINKVWLSTFWFTIMILDSAVYIHVLPQFSHYVIMHRPWVQVQCLIKKGQSMDLWLTVHYGYNMSTHVEIEMKFCNFVKIRLQNDDPTLRWRYSVISLIFMRQMFFTFSLHRYKLQTRNEWHPTCAQSSLEWYSVLWLTYNVARVVALAAWVHTR